MGVKMTNPTVQFALGTLKKEANGYVDDIGRNCALSLLEALEQIFISMDSQLGKVRHNPSDKTVIRDDDGTVIGAQG